MHISRRWKEWEKNTLTETHTQIKTFGTACTYCQSTDRILCFAPSCSYTARAKVRMFHVSASHPLHHHHALAQLLFGFYCHIWAKVTCTLYSYSLICWLYCSHGYNDYVLRHHFSFTLDKFMRCFHSYIEILA